MNREGILPTPLAPAKSRILMIENNANHAEMVVEILRHALPMIEVEVAATGGEGLARIGQGGYGLVVLDSQRPNGGYLDRLMAGWQYAMVILDYHLPDGDGLFWLERILEVEPDLPVVMVTGRGSEGVAAEAFRQGAWDYVVKSIDYLDLLPPAVERGLEKARLIQEQRRQAEEIAYLKQFNEEIVSALPLCLIVLDRQLRVIFSNRSDCVPWGGCCQRGCSLKEVFGRLERQELARLLREAHRVRKSGRPAELPEVRWRKEGSARVLRIQFTAMPGGKAAAPGSEPWIESRAGSVPDQIRDPGQALLLVVEDITSKREMERQAIEAKNKLEAIFGAISDEIVLVDRDFVIQDLNHSPVHTTNKFPSELIGQPCYREFAQREAVCPGCPAQTVFETGQPISSTQTGSRQDGSPVEVEISAYPLRDERGDVIQAVEYVRDVTEERRSMRQIEQSRRLSALGEMVAGIAHEVKNPLQNIRLGLDLLKRELGRGEPLGQVLEGVEQGMRTIDTIVQELLDYSRPLQLHRAPWDLRQVVGAALCDQEAALEAQGIRVVRDWGEEACEAWVDGVRLGQVLTNLFSNAREAMAQGGELRVSLGRQQRQGQEWQAIEISDTGCGISAESLERIFEPFFTSKGSGVGLGLAIAHRIVALHQGRLEVRSQPGQGTTLTVLLPGEDR